MKHYLTAIILTMPLAAAACSDCNILSTNMPAHCEALLVGGLIVAAPVLLPVALIQEAADGQ